MKNFPQNLIFSVSTVKLDDFAKFVKRNLQVSISPIITPDILKMTQQRKNRVKDRPTTIVDRTHPLPGVECLPILTG